MSRRAAKGTPTALNLFTLAQAFGSTERIPNRLPPTSYNGIKRCFAAGLVALADDDSKDLVLTAAGKQALAERAAKETA